ncbi:hypothetical protein [Bacillus tuaregi]|uniref:hypothetical protein n=1 Tax=Bacillus tuaregi TaxID=1816695 RepID=UPI000A4412B5|nr:hypothetical protein [Bacillus tuaregi]
MENHHWKRKLLAIYTGQFFSLLSSAAVQFSIIWWLTDTTGGSPLVLSLAVWPVSCHKHWLAHLQGHLPIVIHEK